MPQNIFGLFLSPSGFNSIIRRAWYYYVYMTTDLPTKIEQDKIHRNFIEKSIRIIGLFIIDGTWTHSRLYTIYDKYCVCKSILSGISILIVVNQTLEYAKRMLLKKLIWFPLTSCHLPKKSHLIFDEYWIWFANTLITLGIVEMRLLLKATKIKRGGASKKVAKNWLNYTVGKIGSKIESCHSLKRCIRVFGAQLACFGQNE